jgi:hypothetical protein
LKGDRRLAIKWTDDGKEDKGKLVTNKSSEDLVTKIETNQQIAKVDSHKLKDRQPKKSAMKPYTIDHNKLTGLDNFTEISKNPLLLPDYYGTTKDSCEMLPAKLRPEGDE